MASLSEFFSKKPILRFFVRSLIVALKAEISTEEEDAEVSP